MPLIDILCLLEGYDETYFSDDMLTSWATPYGNGACNACIFILPQRLSVIGTFLTSNIIYYWRYIDFADEMKIIYRHMSPSGGFSPYYIYNVELYLSTLSKCHTALQTRKYAHHFAGTKLMLSISINFMWHKLTTASIIVERHGHLCCRFQICR